MGLLVGLQFREELDPILAEELDQIAAAVQSAFAERERGNAVGLILGLQHREELDPLVANELDQFCAAMQIAFGSSFRVIQSVQEIEITVTFPATTATGTLATAVNPSTTVCSLLGFRNNSATGSGEDVALYVSGITATTVTVVKDDGSGFTDVRIRLMVVEYVPEVLTSNGVQYGVVSLGSATSGTATIQPVGDKYQLHCLGWSVNYGFTGDADGSESPHGSTVERTSASVITGRRNTGSGTPAHVGFCIADFAQ